MEISYRRHAEILGIGRDTIVHRSVISIPIMNCPGEKFQFFKFGAKVETKLIQCYQCIIEPPNAATFLLRL